jgi:hypothetical protein
MSPHDPLEAERPLDHAQARATGSWVERLLSAVGLRRSAPVQEPVPVPDTAAVTEPDDDYVPTWEELGVEDAEEEDRVEVWGPFAGPPRP